MSKVTIVSCDVCLAKDASSRTVPVVFITEQTEGRHIKPSAVKGNEKIDICNACFEHMLTNREMLTAAGAQGFNRYWFASKGGAPTW